MKNMSKLFEETVRMYSDNDFVFENKYHTAIEEIYEHDDSVFRQWLNQSKYVELAIIKYWLCILNSFGKKEGLLQEFLYIIVNLL